MSPAVPPSQDALQKAKQRLDSAEKAAAREPASSELRLDLVLARLGLAEVLLDRGASAGATILEAMDEAERLVELAPENAECWLARGRALALQEQTCEPPSPAPGRIWEAALDCFQRAIDLAPDPARALQMRALRRAHRNTSGRVDESQELDEWRIVLHDLDLVVQTQPAYPSRMLRGCAHLDCGRSHAAKQPDAESHFAQAILDFDAAIRSFPDSPTSWRGKGECLLYMGLAHCRQSADPIGCWQEAIECLTRACDLDPEPTDALAVRAKVRAELAVRLGVEGHPPQKLLREALEDLGRALDLDPTRVGNLLLRGQIGVFCVAHCVRADLPTEPTASAAKADLDRFLEQAPQGANAHELRAWLRAMTSDWAGASSDFAEAARRDPAGQDSYQEIWEKVRAKERASAWTLRGAVVECLLRLMPWRHGR